MNIYTTHERTDAFYVSVFWRGVRMISRIIVFTARRCLKILLRTTWRRRFARERRGGHMLCSVFPCFPTRFFRVSPQFRFARKPWSRDQRRRGSKRIQWVTNTASLYAVPAGSNTYFVSVFDEPYLWNREPTIRIHALRKAYRRKTLREANIIVLRSVAGGFLYRSGAHGLRY